eukprot:Awhi_evm2s15377
MYLYIFKINNNTSCITGLSSDENLIDGEARIYAQLARLAYICSDRAFAEHVVNQKIIPDQVIDSNSPLLGSFGLPAASDGDAEAWNTLESILTMCMISGGNDGLTGSEFFN